MDIFEAGRRGYKHKNLLFWMGMLNSLVTPVKPKDCVLDFGCGHGLFLPLLFEMQPFHRGIGIDLDRESINLACQRLTERGANWPIEYVHTDQARHMPLSEYFDVIFAQEVLWYNQNLSDLANYIFNLLKPGGRAYFTMGSHPQHPLWERRQKNMLTDGIHSHSWTIDEVAKAFTDAGFSVGLRRLPIDGFFMYHPEAIAESSGSLYDLVQATTECKMLFYFGKHEPVERAITIRG